MRGIIIYIPIPVYLCLFFINLKVVLNQASVASFKDITLAQSESDWQVKSFQAHPMPSLETLATLSPSGKRECPFTLRKPGVKMSH